ncbi:MAG: NlpC/P60 family protein, partial [Romboutsia sp.]
WYKIKLSNGSIGWASSDYITKGSTSNDNSNNSSNEVTLSGYATVTTSTLNVRSGAGTSYSVIGKVYKNDKVELLSSKNGWYKIKLSNGSIGWASSDYITKGSISNDNSSNNPSVNKREAIANLAKAQIGKPYVWGAEGPDSFDCSGLVYYVYKNAASITLPRTSIDQSKVGTTVSMSNLQVGDLVFSSTDGSGKVNHVGIYIGNGEMVHSPKPGQNVQKVNINSSYWVNSYLWSKRVL